MIHPSLRLTVASKSDPEMIVGQKVSINLTRYQFYFRVKKEGPHDGMTKFVMNTPDEVVYVVEDHDEIEKQLKEIE